MEALDALSEKLDDYFAGKSQVLAAYLFGSRARGNQRPGSDVDIAVLLEDRRGALSGLREELFSELSRVLRLDIHLVVLNGSSYVLRVQALFRGKLVHVKDLRALAEFRAMSHSLYADFAPTLRRLQGSAGKGIGGAHGGS